MRTATTQFDRNAYPDMIGAADWEEKGARLTVQHDVELPGDFTEVINIFWDIAAKAAEGQVQLQSRMATLTIEAGGRQAVFTAH